MTAAIVGLVPTPLRPRPAGPGTPVAIAAAGAYALCVVAALLPVRPLGGAAVALLLGTVGHALVGRSAAGLPTATRAGLALGTGLLAGGLGALGLATTGAFGAPGVAALGALLVAAAAAGARTSGSSTRDPDPRAQTSAARTLDPDPGAWDLAPGARMPAPGAQASPPGAPTPAVRTRGGRIAALPLVLLAIAGAGSATIPAYAFDLGGRDAGFYVLTSQHLRSTGQVDLPLDADVRDGLRRFAPGLLGRDADRPLPGFYAGERGRDGRLRSVVPHGYALVPAAMAAGATVTGGGGQWVVTLSGVTLVLLAAGAAALLAGTGRQRVAAAATGVLLAANAALLYFSRYPMTEVLSGAVLLTAGVATAAAARRPDRRIALLAGVALGAAPLVRPDAWPLLVVAPVAAAVLARRDRGQAAVFLAGFGLLCAAALARALATARAYTDEAVGQVVGGVTGSVLVAALTLAGVAGTALVVAVAGRERVRAAVVRVARGADDSRVRRAVAAAALLGVVVAVHPPSTGLGILREYATRPGLVLAAAGVAALLLVRDADRGARTVAFLPLVLLGAVALGLVAGDPQVLVPDQYWTARRYLPLPLPLVAILGGVAVAHGWARVRPGRPGRATAAVAGLLLLAAVAGSLSDARQALTVTEFAGVPEQVDRIDGLLVGRDPLVLAGPAYTSWAVLAPSLALREGRDVVMLDRREVERRPRSVGLNDPALGRWIAGVAARRPVYLVTANVPLFGLTYDPRVLRPRLVGSRTLRLRQIEHAVGRPPATSASRTDLISVFRLEPVRAG